jgi:hypothetical protein
MRALALLAASLVLSLALAEWGLRRAEPLWRIRYPPVCYRPDLYQRFDAYGYRLWPSRRMQHRHPHEGGRTVTIVSDADGFRTRELRAADPRPRVVLLGDSMVFGVGVEAVERLTERLEALEPGWRVDNLGMVGYGPDLMLRALETVGLEPAAAVVVMALFSHDLYRVVPEASGAGFPIPRYRLEDGRLVTVPYPTPHPWERLLLVQGLRYVYFRYTDTTFALNAAILDRFRTLGRERGFTPAVAFLPGPRERFDDRRRRAFLHGWAAQHATPFLDLTDAVRAAGGVRLYLPDDAHWNPEGHAVAAPALREWLADLVLRRP